MSNSVEFDEIFAGQPALIVAVAPDGGRVDFRYPNGNTGYLTNVDPIDLKIGQIILINGNQYRIGSSANWNEPTRIGVVRSVLSERIIIEDGYNLHLIPLREEEVPIVGQTIVYSDLGIRETISETPIVPRGIALGSVEPESYLWMPGEKRLSFDDFGGYPDVVARSRELIEIPLKRADELRSIRARPIKGVLFTGPPGTGKTHLARVIADQSEAAFYSISGPEIVSKWVGDSEGNLRKLFDDARRKGRAVVFFDEIDSIAERRTEDSHEASKRVVAQLLTLMDGFKEASSNIVVIAATNRPNDIDPALRRPGRFDWEIVFPMPTADDRLHILKVSMRHLNVRHPEEMPLEGIANRTDGWSAARLTSLWTEAALLAAGDGRGALRAEDLVGAFERLSSRNVSSEGEG